MQIATKPRPFLKWAGGKQKLIRDLGPMVPNFTGRYFEPFVGGGALFFHLAPKKALISDINPELINAYKVVRDNVEPLIKSLRKHRNEADYYYELRNRDRCTDFYHIGEVQRASRFIYLNKTCYNGLHRENLSGQMNTPFGNYKNPAICDADNLRSVSEQLKGIEIKEISFEDLMMVRNPPTREDFVYFDPPYVPINQTSFTSYTRHGFDIEDQRALLKLCKSLDRVGAKFMLSNSSAPILRELYQDFDIHTIYAARSINSKGTGRGVIPEIVVRNF